MTAVNATLGRLVMVRMDPDEDVLAALRSAVQEHGLQNGVILSGVGSLYRYRVHVVGKPSLPTKDVFLSGEGAYDILAITGFVLDGRVHAHITFAGTETALGGHLEDGCSILTFGAVVIAETPNADLAGWDTVGPLTHS